MDHEKYISIEYNIWETKYKPMEQELEQLKKDYNEEKRSKTVIVSVKRDSLWYSGYPKSIGTVDIKISSNNHSEEIKTIIKEIRQEIGNLTCEPNFRMSSNLKYLTCQEAKDFIDNIEIKTDEYRKLINDNIERYKKIPKFIRWIFGIKLK
jgi:hypothetical protein